MPDMLVKLYGAPLPSRAAALAQDGIAIKRAMALDKAAVLGFVGATFGESHATWLGECEVALLQQPSTCFIAVAEARVIGFCCYDSTARGMVGPLGVDPAFRGRGIAPEMMRRTFEAMQAAGYAYAVIGWVSSASYYAKVCGAIEIPDSLPGVYSRMISPPTVEA